MSMRHRNNSKISHTSKRSVVNIPIALFPEKCCTIQNLVNQRLLTPGAHEHSHQNYMSEKSQGKCLVKMQPLGC